MLEFTKYDAARSLLIVQKYKVHPELTDAELEKEVDRDIDLTLQMTELMKKADFTEKYGKVKC